VITIDQTKALNGSVTPGDAPGFPVTITQPGHYRLSGPLTVAEVNKSGIEINASNVTIDLNGFAILGLNVCGSLAFSSTGNGIDSLTGSNTVVRNGTISGMGYHGILGAVHVENVRVLCSFRGILVSAGRRGRIVSNTISGTAEAGILAASFNELTVVEGNVVEGSNISVGKAVVTGNTVNSGSGMIGITASGVVANNTVSGGFLGIQTGGSSTIIGNAVISTGSVGIAAGTGSTVKDNTVTNSGANGITCGNGCTVIGNTSRANNGFGLSASSFTGYANNVLTANTSGPVSSAPTEIGTNLCDTDTTCP
jgi:putative cofactor-binding repeat protein